jgi:hypothetical protein
MQGAEHGRGKGTEPEHRRFQDVSNSKKEGNQKPREHKAMINQSVEFIWGSSEHFMPQG